MQGDTEPRAYHALPATEVLTSLETTASGLTSSEVARRRAQFGPNVLPTSEPTPILRAFLAQFRNPLIYILGLAGAVSLAIGEGTDAGFIFGVLVINAIIGALQEHKAEQSSRALARLLTVRATVMRDGEPRDLDAEELVPGDVVALESGQRVPADLRLLRAHGLEVNESLLTGESLAAEKDAGWRGPDNAPVGDRRNMAYAGAVVVRGRAKGVVVETGLRTLVGRLAEDVTEREAGKPPLLVRLERFTRVIGIVVLLAAILVGVIGVVFRGFSVAEMFFVAVALSVSAIPEGLPVALTVALSVATTRMARRKVIVRKLASVEGLGSCTLIATDKTGTLTCNELTVRRLLVADGRALDIEGQGYEPTGGITLRGEPIVAGEHPSLQELARAAVLCNEGHLASSGAGGWTHRGDPTDVALLVMAHKLGWTREAALDAHAPVQEIPFEPERKYSASVHHAGGGALMVVKGAPERVLEMCSFEGDEEAMRADWSARATALASDGYRVLALAERTLPEVPDAEAAPVEPRELRFLGFVGMIDPLRSGVREAIERCRAAGVSVTMITGDHPRTALAIGRELGLAHTADEVVSGADLVDVSVERLRSIVGRTRIFARVSPAQKLDIVKAAKAAGHFVAVTGDGVNDAPALREANIGVAMGKDGTDMAREAAELVIADDNFATIVGGIEEGRIAYANVRKVIFLLVSTGAAEVVLVLLSIAGGTPLPLLPVQLLWLNLVTNGIQHVGLAFEPGEGGVLSQPPRAPSERIFDRLMIERTVIAALVMGVVGFGAFVVMLAQGYDEAMARNGLLLLMVLFENVHVGNSRSETSSLFRLAPWRNPLLLAGTASAFLLHLGAMYFPPARSILGTAPVPLADWTLLVVLALTIAVASELHKFFWAWRARGRETANVVPRMTGEPG